VDGPLDVESAAVDRLATWLGELIFQRSNSVEQFQFHRVFKEWPEGAQAFKGYPTACIQVQGEGEGDDGAELAPVALPEQVRGFTLFLVKTMTIPLTLDLWCKHPVELEDVERMLEQEMAPDEETGSLLLPMPRYWGQLARFAWLRQRRWKDAEAGTKNDSRLTWSLEATVPVLRAKRLPKMLQPELITQIGTDVVP
jgi:hypothetical protein